MNHGRRAILVLCLLAALGSRGIAIAAPSQAKPYRCLFRVNTNISAGTVSPEEIAKQAKAEGIDVLVFSDQFHSRAEFGLPGFRGIIKVTRERPSVLTYGPSAYLQRINKIQGQYADLVLIPAIDVAPYYYWQGSALRRNLSVHQWSRQLTVLGLEDAEVIKRMPVTANPHAPKRWTPWSFVRLLPVLLVPLGFLLMRWRRIDYRDEQGNHTVMRNRSSVVTGIVVILAGVLLLASGYPYAEPAHWDQYRPTDGPEPYQAYLDWLSGQPGTMAFWSAPEAKHEETIQGVRFVTEPHLSQVATLRGATGFAGIYGDARTACKPGEMWDRTLMEYCKGHRQRPLLIVGERDYHGGPLGGAETVLILSKLNRETVLEEGFRQGRMYTISPRRNGRLTLDDFSVREADGPDNAFLAPLHTQATKLKIHVALRSHYVTSQQDDIRVRIIRDGAVLCDEKVSVASVPGGTLWEKTLADDNPSEQPISYYRLLLHSRRTGEILTNPIFVFREGRSK